MTEPLRTAEKLTEEAVLNVGSEILRGEVDSKDTPARYLGYLARFRPILQPFSRYLAYVASHVKSEGKKETDERESRYTSDVGEAARPIVSARIGASIL